MIYGFDMGFICGAAYQYSRSQIAQGARPIKPEHAHRGQFGTISRQIKHLECPIFSAGGTQVSPLPSHKSPDPDPARGQKMFLSKNSGGASESSASL
jgi:hypothetical protein